MLDQYMCRSITLELVPFEEGIEDSDELGMASNAHAILAIEQAFMLQLLNMLLPGQAGVVPPVSMNVGHGVLQKGQVVEGVEARACTGHSSRSMGGGGTARTGGG